MRTIHPEAAVILVRDADGVVHAASHYGRISWHQLSDWVRVRARSSSETWHMNSDVTVTIAGEATAGARANCVLCAAEDFL